MPPALVARIRESEPVRRQANKFGPGVTPAWDKDDHVAVIEFDSEQFTREMAETWLNEKKYSQFTIDEDIVEKPRTFGYPFANLGGKFEKTQEGGLRVKGVKLLAAGTWTDSAQKTPCEYSSEVLKQFAGNWHDNAIWSRHFGGVPRNITEKVGIVENPRFEDDAIVGDLYYHGLTQQSKDTIAMVENGLANYVSVETMSKDRWNVGKKVYQAQELGFTGLATVNQGACRVCKIRDNESGSIQEAEMPDNKREDEIVSEQGSLENLRDKIREALQAKFPRNQETGWGPYLIATLPDQVIYEVDPGTKYRISYTIDESGQITFGDPIEVTIVYQDISEKPGAFEQEIEMDEKALEAKLEAMKKELSESSEKKIKELEGKLAASETVNKELSARLEKVEKIPDPKTLGSWEEQDVKELEFSPYRIVHKDGTVRRV